MARLTAEQANKIFDILVEFGGNSTFRASFVARTTANISMLSSVVSHGFTFPAEFGFKDLFGPDARFIVDSGRAGIVLCHEPMATEDMVLRRRTNQKKLNKRLESVMH